MSSFVIDARSDDGPAVDEVRLDDAAISRWNRRRPWHTQSRKSNADIDRAPDLSCIGRCQAVIARPCAIGFEPRNPSLNSGTSKLVRDIIRSPEVYLIWRTAAQRAMRKPLVIFSDVESDQAPNRGNRIQFV